MAAQAFGHIPVDLQLRCLHRQYVDDHGSKAALDFHSGIGPERVTARIKSWAIICAKAYAKNPKVTIY